MSSESRKSAQLSSAGRPQDFSNFATAAFVWFPRSPSIVPGSKPRSFSFCCVAVLILAYFCPSMTAGQSITPNVPKRPNMSYSFFLPRNAPAAAPATAPIGPNTRKPAPAAAAIGRGEAPTLLTGAPAALDATTDCTASTTVVAPGAAGISEAPVIAIVCESAASALTAGELGESEGIDSAALPPDAIETPTIAPVAAAASVCLIVAEAAFPVSSGIPAGRAEAIAGRAPPPLRTVAPTAAPAASSIP